MGLATRPTGLEWRAKKSGRGTIRQPPEDMLRLITVAAAGLLPLLAPGLVWSQTALDHQQSESSEQTQNFANTGTPESTAGIDAQVQMVKLTPLPLTLVANDNRRNSDHKQTNRILWVVPNFTAVSADSELPPLTTAGKFMLATRDSVDYSNFTWTAILAGQAMATRSVPEFGMGMKGYGTYYWHLFVDGVSGNFFTEAILPTITHEDPRYYTLGHGNVFHRMGYALSRTIFTKTDSGGRSFNWSMVGGNAFEAGLSNAYYPSQERGVKQTAQNWGEQMESSVLSNIAMEFWPDIRHTIFRRD